MNKLLFVFSQKDHVIAEKLSTRLEPHNIYIQYEDLDTINDYHLFDKTLFNLETNDILVFIFSKESEKYNWVNNQLAFTINNQLRKRNILVISILLPGSRIPPSIKEKVSFKIGKEEDRDIDRVVKYIKNIPSVNLDLLSPSEFEDLVVALLKKLNFSGIRRGYDIKDLGGDIHAQTLFRDPFGNKHSINWLIEIKFYKESRADLKSLTTLVGQLKYLPLDYRGLLITNSQLTSSAKEWLDENEKKSGSVVSIVEGPKIKEIVLKYDDLIEKFFNDKSNYGA